MRTIFEICLKCIHDLNQIREYVNNERSRAFPRCIFDLELCSKELAVGFKKESISLGFSGKIREEVPQLEGLRQSIIRITGVCSTGGFGVPPDAIYEIISKVINDLEKQNQNFSKNKGLAFNGIDKQWPKTKNNKNSFMRIFKRRNSDDCSSAGNSI